MSLNGLSGPDMTLHPSPRRSRTFLWLLVGTAVLIVLILFAVVYSSQLATKVATTPVKVSGTITAKGPRIAITQGLRYKTVLPQPAKAKKVEVCWVDKKKKTICRVLAGSVKGNQAVVLLPVNVPKGAATIKVTERLATGALGPVLYNRAVLVRPRTVAAPVEQDSGDGGGGGGGSSGGGGGSEASIPEPTPEASPSESPTSSVVPSASPSVSPVVSPSPLPSPTPSPSPSPSPSPTPEIDIQGNSLSITDGDTTPILSDHTDFGSALVTGGTVTRRYTVRNIGTGTLTIGTTPTFTGTHAADFSAVGSVTSTTIASAGTATFDVRFDPSAAGTRTAILNLTNNDANENPYNFTVQGNGTVPTPSPSPSPSPTPIIPTPSPSPSVVPTSIPTPSVSPIPTPSPSPSPVPSVSPTPTVAPTANFTVPVDNEVWLVEDPLDVRVQLTLPQGVTLTCQQWKLDGVLLPASAWVPGQTPNIQPCP